MVPNERSSGLLTVTCTCGRSLRAKPEQVGTEVRCWDCHKMVPVHDPHEGQRVARELSDSAMVVMQGPGLNATLLAAAIVTAVLAIPYWGAWVSVVAFMMGASVYGQIIRRVSRGPIGDPDSGLMSTLIPRTIPELIICSLMAAGTVVPLWLLNAGTQQSPHWDWLGRTMAALAWVLGPVMMLAHYARTDEDAPLGLRRTVRLLASHPIAAILAIAMIPMTLVLLEVGLGVIMYFSSSLPFYALDYMPMPRSPAEAVMHSGVPHYDNMDYRSFPDSLYFKGYFDGLRHGYSFVGAVPPSLSMDTRAGMDPVEGMGVFEPFYLFFRLLIIMTVLTCLFTAFAIQARWLGSMPALNRRRA